MFREFTTEVPVFARADYNILDFGAVAGGRVPCTEAFARAIEKASEKGGRVIVPNGIFLTGPIVLLSGVELHLEDNAVIIFTENSAFEFH
jgi:polygalacturonase